MDDFELLKLIHLQKEVKESCPSKKIIDKLISDQEIRSALLVESTNKPLSKHLGESGVKWDTSHMGQAQ